MTDEQVIRKAYQSPGFRFWDIERHGPVYRVEAYNPPKGFSWDAESVRVKVDAEVVEFRQEPHRLIGRYRDAEVVWHTHSAR